MPEPLLGVYERQWSPREYLRQFYSEPPVSADEAANARFLAAELRALGQMYGRGLEIGCGPTVHHAASLAPWVGSLDLADYLPDNLAEVRRWLDRRPDAHDWTVYLSGVLEAEGGGSVEARRALLRERVSALLPGDIRRPHPLGGPQEYELVASYYCAEAVATTRAEWAECLANVCRLVAPGGVLFLGAMRRCREYHVLGRTFPTAYVDEADFAAELSGLGFPPKQLLIETVSGVGWGEQGFDSICCVRAVKAQRRAELGAAELSRVV